MFNILNEDNLALYAAKSYSSLNCLMSEFEDDFKRAKYIKRLVRRYYITKILKDRLILNHIIMMGNVFGPEATAHIMFFRIDEIHHSILKTFLLYLNILPKKVYGIRGKVIDTDIIPVDLIVADALRKI